MMKHVERVFDMTSHTQGQTGHFHLRLWDSLIKLSFTYSHNKIDSTDDGTRTRNPSVINRVL